MWVRFISYVYRLSENDPTYLSFLAKIYKYTMHLRKQHWAQAVAQWVKCLLCELKNLKLEFRAPTEEAGCGGIHLQSQSWEMKIGSWGSQREVPLSVRDSASNSKVRHLMSIFMLVTARALTHTVGGGHTIFKASEFEGRISLKFPMLFFFSV